MPLPRCLGDMLVTRQLALHKPPQPLFSTGLALPTCFGSSLSPITIQLRSRDSRNHLSNSDSTSPPCHHPCNIERRVPNFCAVSPRPRQHEFPPRQNIEVQEVNGRVYTSYPSVLVSEARATFFTALLPDVSARTSSMMPVRVHHHRSPVQISASRPVWWAPTSELLSVSFKKGLRRC